MQSTTPCPPGLVKVATSQPGSGNRSTPLPPSAAKAADLSVKTMNRQNFSEVPSRGPVRRGRLTEPRCALTPEEMGIPKEIMNPSQRRTQETQTWLRCMLPENVTRDGKLLVGTRMYEVVSMKLSDFTGRPVASIGSNREILTLTPSSRTLLRMFSFLREKIQQEFPPSQDPVPTLHILNKVREFVANDIFPPLTDGALEQLLEFVQEKERTGYVVTTSTGQKVPLISIDDVIHAKNIAFCRHHALLTAHLVQRLVREGILPKGIVKHMRFNMDDSAHAWVNFYTEDGKKYHIDTLWDVLVEFSDPHHRQCLAEAYGKEIIDQQNKIADYSLKG